ncbi:MAG: hypothetical protein JNM18_02265, partial [Planctomycetaceae bacterium]|nr:hypothetical protein [Planctomycetaceae bacterium]
AQVRWSAASRAAVALPQGPYLETAVERLTVVEGQDAELPVRLVGDNVDGKWSLIACHSTNGVAFGLGVQQEVTIRDGQAIFPLSTQRLPVGTHSIVVARAYRSDIRINLPGPCTPIVLVDVVRKSATTAGK